jgi:hypothetical protein
MTQKKNEEEEKNTVLKEGKSLRKLEKCGMQQELDRHYL